MTQRMDDGMRKMIDGQHSLQSMKDSLAATATDARAHASTQASTQRDPHSGGGRKLMRMGTKRVKESNSGLHSYRSKRRDTGCQTDN